MDCVNCCRETIYLCGLSPQRRGELIAELKCLPGGRCRLLTGSSALLAKAQRELKTNWQTQRMGIGNMVLNRRKNCPREAATSVSEEPAFQEAQVSPAKAAGLNRQVREPRAARTVCSLSPVPTLTPSHRAWPEALLVLGVHEECVISLKGWRTHQPTAALWLGRGDLLGTLYAYRQAASAVTNPYGVPRRIYCDGRDNSPASELPCRAWEMAGLLLLATSLESCLHKAAAAGDSLCSCAPTPRFQPRCTCCPMPAEDTPVSQANLITRAPRYLLALPAFPGQPCSLLLPRLLQKVSEASRGRSCQRHKRSCCYATLAVQQLTLGKTCCALKLFA